MCPKIYHHCQCALRYSLLQCQVYQCYSKRYIYIWYYRCTSDIAPASKCPIFNCPAVNCGDNEDIALGRKYRETVQYNVNGELCQGCEQCLDCPISECPERLDPRCERYTRRTDRRGCVVCPFCEIWTNNLPPPINNRTGFLQVK